MHEWLAHKLDEHFCIGPPFALSVVAQALGAPHQFVERYAARLVKQGKLTPNRPTHP
ncbi:hypothetical protein [Streptomyces filamentosus]|uniref:hypothetical protein n=1 Tax=Streptomyces filamentosus TaxID=67294 RepID=UPI0033FC8E33